MSRMESFEIRRMYVDILKVLKKNGMSENVLARDEFNVHYNRYVSTRGDVALSNNDFLFKASRLNPPLLKVINHSMVKFIHGFTAPASAGWYRRNYAGQQNRVTLGPQTARVQQRRQHHGTNFHLETHRSWSSAVNRTSNWIERPIQSLNNGQCTSIQRYPRITSTVSRQTQGIEPVIKAFEERPGAFRRRPTVHKPSTVWRNDSVETISQMNNDTKKPDYLDVRRTSIGSASRDSGNSETRKGGPSKTQSRSKKRNSKEQRKNDSEFQKRKIIDGIRPSFVNGGNREESWILDKFYVPVEIEVEYRSGQLQRSFNLRAPLSPNSYSEKLHLLLYIEELQYQTEIAGYTMESAVIHKKPRSGKDLLYLEVPGLAENRPSLLIGDRVYAVRLDANEIEYGDRYVGYVHDVEKQQVSLGFSSKLTSVCLKNMKCSFRFTFNRRPLRLMHRALDGIEASRLAEMLFPMHHPEPYVPPKGKLFMKKRDIESNDEQRTAVENIVLGKIPPIYIIFGPPGTGKTVTMVEAIYQTQKLYNYNILVCALCNNACDMLASKLQEYVDKSKMIRVYAASRSWQSVPEKVKKGNTNFRDRELYMPDERELSGYRIIIWTFVTAGRIASMKFGKGHFQRIFIDESGQAFEPECLVAVTGVLAKDGKLILAGDPKQLGPIVRSPLAIRHGLQMSLLQRLMDTCPVYQKDIITGKYNQQCVTKLVRNYRSHDVILRISNEHFYDGELQVCADELKRNKMCGWEWLKNKKFPIIFHGIEGKQTQDESSPSYYNPDEVKIVKGYVEKLMQSRGTHKLMSPSYIGIVTPYRKQCEKIRQAIKKYPEIDVGSVEVFQGQERPVIIISTVRSSKEGLTDDAKYHLGFLCDPKRFNVALTRAQALLVIVGNPRMLSLDKFWKSLLKYCLENDAYCGAKFSSEDFKGASDMDEIENLFKKMELEPLEECENEEDLAAPFWRREH